MRLLLFARRKPVDGRDRRVHLVADAVAPSRLRTSSKAQTSQYCKLLIEAVVFMACIGTQLTCTAPQALCRALNKSSRAFSHWRCTVRSLLPMSSAISTMLKPQKNFRSTT